MNRNSPRTRPEDAEWLLSRLVDRLLSEHPLPWRFELDWAYEVYDARDRIIMKCQSASQAKMLIALGRAAHEAEEHGNG